MKKMLFILILLFFGIFLVFEISKYTFAYSYDLNEATLFYKNNKKELEYDIKKYLDNIDNLLIINSSFEYSDILVNNYDFLVRFAMGYIIMNREVYRDKIVIKDNFSYFTKEMKEKNTNYYISLQEIYDVTDNFFGVRDFEIINKDVYVIGDYISLVDYTSEKFSLKIKDVQILEDLDEVKVLVMYENDVKYLYTFVNVYNVLKIKNIEVLS